MKWIQDGGKQAPIEAVSVATKASREMSVPVGILLGTCECETNFRLNLVSVAGAVGPVQFLPTYELDYYRYAGFDFDLYGWDALRGLAGVYKKYAEWGKERYGLQGDDAWRYAVNSHRYGQNSPTSRDMQSKRVVDVEYHMARNGLWYNDIITTEAMDMAADNAHIAEQAVQWALTKVGCKYDQAKRTQPNIFDCSSLVARAYTALGVEWGCQGAPVPTSQYEVYDDHFELLWPATYVEIGKVMGGADVIKKATQAGDLQFLHTSSTSRANKITHVTMVVDKSTIVHARNSTMGVRTDNIDLYAGKVCAVVRYNPEGPLREGMQGSRVKALQKTLNEKGAGLTADGIYGAKTAAAVAKYGDPTPAPEPSPTPTPEPTPAPSTSGKVEITGNSVNIRSGPGTNYTSLGKCNKGDTLPKLRADGWVAVEYNGKVGFVSAQYAKEV